MKLMKWLKKLKSNLNEIWHVIWGEHFENLAKIHLTLKRMVTFLTTYQDRWFAIQPEQLILRSLFI